ncbi:MAG: hypothetical protein QOH08_665 [Chloroflexota bacterium]|nr:hypothetical protein [Chloroflexota bacterium]
MARAMRPVVILMLLATILFVVDGILDHNYAILQFPNQSILDEYKGVGWTSFVFAIANLLMTLAVARGSERTLLGRIALSAFFIIERPVTAFVLGPKPIESIVVHFATAVVELIILVGAIRVWRLGHSLVPADMDAMFRLDPPGPGAATATWTPETAPIAVERPAPVAHDVPSGGSAWLLGIVTLVLAAILVADGVAGGFIPGGHEWGLAAESSGWLVYVFAVIILMVATRAVRGGIVGLRLLFAVALILFCERAFSPFAVRVVDPVRLGLHGIGAFVALALALAAAGAIRPSAGSADESSATPPSASAAT